MGKELSKDDLYDVVELTEKIEESLNLILQDQDLSIGMSALLTGFCRGIFNQCSSLEQVMFYRSLLNRYLDSCICEMIKDSEIS